MLRADPQPPTRVLLADSSRMGNQLLSNAFPRDRRLKLIGQAATSTELLQGVSPGCDVAIIAANLERKGGGVAAARLLRDLHPAVKVVLLLDDLNGEAVTAAFRAGARGVFGRSQALNLLWKCTACVHAGQIWAGSQELQHLLAALQQSMPARITNLQGTSLLSEQEEKVVRHVCEGLSNREIAERMGLSEHTIKNHLFRIYSRLGISSRVEIMFSVLSQHVVRAPLGAAEAPLSDEAMFQLYLKEAEHFAAAQYMVGKMYLEGRGTERDLVTGYMWLTMAQQTSREVFNECSLAKNRLADQMKGEERTAAESRAAERRQHWHPALLEAMTPPRMLQQSNGRPVLPRRNGRKKNLQVRMVSGVGATSNDQLA